MIDWFTEFVSKEQTWKIEEVRILMKDLINSCHFFLVQMKKKRTIAVYIILSNILKGTILWCNSNHEMSTEGSVLSHTNSWQFFGYRMKQKMMYKYANKNGNLTARRRPVPWYLDNALVPDHLLATLEMHLQINWLVPNFHWRPDKLSFLPIYMTDVRPPCEIHG